MTQESSQAPKKYSKSDSQQTMSSQPHTEGRDYRGSEKLSGKVALITGGDSGIKCNALLTMPLY